MDFRIPLAERLLALAGRRGTDWGVEFARYGYAFLHVEIRGAGASFGTKTSLFGEQVARDGSQVLDWIVQQPWSDGTVGATGISALGLTSIMLGTAKHPALKAIAPRFTVFDIFHSVHPGGLLESRFLADIGRVVRAMDSNQLHGTVDGVLLQLLMRVLVKGVRGVDDDRDRSLLKAAVAEHAENEAFDLDIAEVLFRDDRLPNSSLDGTLDTQSPFRLLPDVEAAEIPVYAYAGWMDAAFQRDLVHLYCNSTHPGSRLIIGPWAHGGAFYSSPLTASEKRRSAFPQAAELVRFFDLHLRGVDHGLSEEPPVHYFTMGEERWKSSSFWPPDGVVFRSFFIAPNGGLTESPPSPATMAYCVDRTATTGVWSRYGKHLSGGNGPAHYPDRAGADGKLLCFDSAPLSEALEVTGHPLVRLSLSVDTSDAALFAYLEDVGPDGTVLMVSDGCLRLSMRAESDDAPYRQHGVWRSWKRGDASPVRPGERVTVRLDLLPTSWLFQAGHRIRVAVAGADADNFVMVPPDGSAPTFTVYVGGEGQSRIDLPTLPRQR